MRWLGFSGLVLSAALGGCDLDAATDPRCRPTPLECSTNLRPVDLPNERILFAGRKPGRGIDLYLTDPAGSVLLNLTDTGDLAETEGQLAADGRSIAYTRWFQLPGQSFDGSVLQSFDDGTIRWYAADGREPTPSPDGQLIAYRDPSGLRLARADGQAVVNSLVSPAGILPAWSPDGSWLAYTEVSYYFPPRSLQVGIFRWDLATRQPTALPAATGSAFSAAIAPRDDLIAFTRYGESGSEIKIAESSGFLEFETGLRGDSPAFSPDGERIVFHRDGRLWIGDWFTGEETLIPGIDFVEESSRLSWIRVPPL